MSKEFDLNSTIVDCANQAISRRAIIKLNNEFKHLDKCKEVNMAEIGADDVEMGR